MLDKFKRLKGTSKALIIACAALGVIAVVMLVAVIATGGFSNPLS